MQEVKPLIKNSQSMEISSFSIDKETLIIFFTRLAERVEAALKLEIDIYQDDYVGENLEDEIKKLRESFTLQVTVKGFEGEELIGPVEDVFGSANFPEAVKSIFVASDTTLVGKYKYKPRNLLNIYFDFSKPKLFDFSLLPSFKTPNGSKVLVEGYDATWVNGVFNEIKTFITRNASTASFVHRHSVYDLLLWTLGIPMSFWFCAKIGKTFTAATNNTFIINTLFLYAFFISINVFRVLFHYLRWICPLVEYKYKNNLNIKHRIIFGVISIGWLGQFLYDVAKWFLMKK